MIRSIISIIAVIALSACTIYTNQFGTYGPNSSNGYRGLIASEPMADVTSTMEQMCRNWGGLNYGSVNSVPSPSMKNFALSYKEYSCNGPSSTKTAEPQVVPQPNSQNAVSSGTYNKSQIDAAKQKCADLGFKPNTENFGKCVLKLSN